MALINFVKNLISGLITLFVILPIVILTAAFVMLLFLYLLPVVLYIFAVVFVLAMLVGGSNDKETKEVVDKTKD